MTWKQLLSEETRKKTNDFNLLLCSKITCTKMHNADNCTIILLDPFRVCYGSISKPKTL